MRTTKTALLPPYAIVLLGVILVLGKDLLSEWSETDPKKLRLRNPADPRFSFAWPCFSILPLQRTRFE